MCILSTHIFTSWSQRKANLDGWGKQSWSPANVMDSCLCSSAAAAAAGCVNLQFNNPGTRRRIVNGANDALANASKIRSANKVWRFFCRSGEKYRSGINRYVLWPLYWGSHCDESFFFVFLQIFELFRKLFEIDLHKRTKATNIFFFWVCDQEVLFNMPK